VDQRASKASHLDRCLAGGNPLAPDLMTASARLDEVAQILAAGLVRLRQRQYLSDDSTLEQNNLDRSVHATARQRRGIRR
jgi:hypothetical protein